MFRLQGHYNSIHKRISRSCYPIDRVLHFYVRAKLQYNRHLFFNHSYFDTTILQGYSSRYVGNDFRWISYSQM